MIYFIIISCLLLTCIVAYSMFHRLSVKKILANQQTNHAENKFSINMLSCTCHEWRAERAKFKPSDPRRLCIHLCNYFADNTSIIPEQLQLFAKTITLMRSQAMGIPHKAPAFAFVLGTRGYVATVEDGKYPVVTVFTEDKIYHYNLADATWKNELQPDFAEEIGNLVKAEIRLRLQKEKIKAIKQKDEIKAIKQKDEK